MLSRDRGWDASSETEGTEIVIVAVTELAQAAGEGPSGTHSGTPSDYHPWAVAPCVRGKRCPRRRPTGVQGKMRKGPQKDQPGREGATATKGLRWARTPHAFVGIDGTLGVVLH